MAAVLVVDDDAHIREVARFALARAGHAVELAADGAAAADRIARGGLELVVLDILMPELDGLTLCRELRGRIPIVVLSSRGEEADRVLGLELGADDYLAKPFSPRELVARVAAVLRRTAAEAVPAPRPALAIGSVTIDRDRHAVRVGDAELVVTATELRLLATLAIHKGRVLSRHQLIATVYGDDHHISARTIDTHVRNLRAKLAAAGAPVIDPAGEDPRPAGKAVGVPTPHDLASLIETVHGVGYRCRG